MLRHFWHFYFLSLLVLIVFLACSSSDENDKSDATGLTDTSVIDDALSGDAGGDVMEQNDTGGGQGVINNYILAAGQPTNKESGLWLIDFNAMKKVPNTSGSGFYKWSGDRKSIVYMDSMGDSSKIIFIDPETGGTKFTMSLGKKMPDDSVFTISHDNSFVVIVDNYEIKKSPVKEVAEFTSITPKYNSKYPEITYLHLSPDSKKLLIGAINVDTSENLIVTDLTGNILNRVSLYTDKARWLNNDKIVVAMASEIFVYDLANNKSESIYKEDAAHSGYIRYFSESPDGNMILFQFDKSDIQFEMQLVDVTTKQLLDIPPAFKDDNFRWSSRFSYSWGSR
ncbi:MAG: hypothetical protein N3B13_03975 [Deltaproteobacteria bacterium]|nr:hypothetical protein [Deltaproteobacteria bacterium]